MRLDKPVHVQATRKIGGQDFTLTAQCDVDAAGEQSGLTSAIGWLQAQFDYLESGAATSAIRAARNEVTESLTAGV